VVHASSLSVVGLVEVVAHIPRIYSEFRKLVRYAETVRPRLAILTDSPDFNLRLARKLKRLGIPIVYLVAPQVWAWREGRVRQIRRDVDRLLCIFPFEEDWFRRRGVKADYIGHPLTRIVRPKVSRDHFFATHALDSKRSLVALLPGSRVGEVARHLSIVADAASRLERETGAQAIMALPAQFSRRAGKAFFRERNTPPSIQIIEGETWDALAYADVSIAASGTVTVEAALLGAPMVTFYRVAPLSWKLGRGLVRAPFLTMVNLIAGRKVVPELMQDEATGERLAAETGKLLEDVALRKEMKREIARVSDLLNTPRDPMERAASIVIEYLN
jgi:lipid-A-disaccharide synthase